MIYLRRLAFLWFGAVLLGSLGLYWLYGSWAGHAGRSPSDLYVPGDFGTRDPLLRLVRVPAVPGAERRACFAIERLRQAAAPDTVCSGDGAELVWVGRGALSVRVGEDGTPGASLAGARFTVDDWIGSGADPEQEASPRFPLRGYGIAFQAARVVACPASGAGGGVACIRVHDRLGRLALARAAGGSPAGDTRLAYDSTYEIRSGDEVWLGLVPFQATVRPRAKGAAPWLGLVRLDHLRPGAGDTTTGVFLHRGGDRRWLGRLWPVDPPEAEAAQPDTVFVQPLAVRYTPGHLSRQRTNYELEDVVQRLVDGEWLCLDQLDGTPRLVWRPLDLPGCEGAAGTVAYTDAAAEDYRIGRDPRLLGSRLVEQSNRLLAKREYLQDPSLLPLAFEWGLHRPDSATAEEPVPLRLWGVRFGATRLRSGADTTAPVAPALTLRTSTARHLIQLFSADTLLADLYLPPGVRVTGGGVPGGSVCLERGTPGSGAVALDAADGGHHPLGHLSVAGRPARLHWMPAGSRCGGCQLGVAAGAGDTTLAVQTLTECPGIRGGAGPAPTRMRLRSGEELAWNAGEVRLRYVRRGDPPWIALTDPVTRERRFAQEFYGPGGLEPVIGNAAGTRGVEASLRAFVRDGGSARALELSLDGDLQLAAARIVDQIARLKIDSASVPPSLEREAQVSAVVLDAWTGEVLAAVNWSRAGARALRASPPNAWELGSGQATAVPNAAFAREEAVGSVFKIAAAYALANTGMVVGRPVGPHSEAWREVDPGGHAGGALYLATASPRGQQRGPTPRQCSTGPHLLPASDSGFTTGTFVQRFARSCNTFFVMTGLRLASHTPAHLRPTTSGAAHPSADTLLVRNAADQKLTLVLSAAPTLADRIRDGLEGDARAGPTAAPHSIYGVLFRAGFHPQPAPQVDVPAGEYGFVHAGRDVRVPLSTGWFDAPAFMAPTLEPGAAFSYPSLPSAGRLDERAVLGRSAVERYGGAVWAVTRPQGEGRPETGFAQLMIGQSLQASALGMAVLYAPAARRDGRAVRPCLFRAACGDSSRTGPVVLDVTPRGQAWVVNEALRAVVTDSGTAAGKLHRAGLDGLFRQWGGKTGTYQRVVTAWPDFLGSERAWEDLVARACGVTGVAAPDVGQLARALARTSPPLADAVLHLAADTPGAALGAVACEARVRPLVPGGIHNYRLTRATRALDEAAVRVRGLQRRDSTIDFHAFALVSPPARGGWPARGGAAEAEGLVVVVLVDHRADIAVEIGGRMAAAAERWAAAAGRSVPRSN
jgi:cell division protein FtsI/penicillin-binding protein 2